MKNNKFSAFTLVELIVVITILAVLATVAFISFQGYTSSSRDSVRLADLKNISKSFELNRTKGIDFPLPDKKVDISSSGTIFQYQGELSQNILNSDLNIFDGGVDPLSGENYGYAVNSARNKFQIIGFLENSSNVANISLNKTFADNSDKYVKSSGDRLGILLDPTTNEIITDENNTLEIDIINTTNTYGLLFGKNIEYGDNKIFNKITNLQKYSLTSSCKKLLERYPDFLNQNDTYTISPDGENIFDVYCDMTRDGGGWTLFGRQLSDNNRIDLQNQRCDSLNEICNGGLKPYLSIIQDKSEILTYGYNTEKVLFRFKFKGNNSPFIQAFAGKSVNIRQYDVSDEIYNDEIFYNDKFQSVPDGHNVQYYSSEGGKSFLVCSAPGSCGQGPVINFGWGKYTNQVSFVSSSVDDWSARVGGGNYDYSIWLRE